MEFTDGQVLVPKQSNEIDFKIAVVEYAVSDHEWEIDHESWLEVCENVKSKTPDDFDLEELENFFDQAMEWIHGVATDYDLDISENQLIIKKV